MNMNKPTWSKGAAQAMFPYLAQRYGIKYFVETGTGCGETLIFMAPAFTQCFSIELHKFKYEVAQAIFSHVPNVKLLYGDSKDQLKTILDELSQLPQGKTFFFLDAHGHPGDDGPLAEEIALIQDACPDALIAIDDVGTEAVHHHDPELPGIDLRGWNSLYKFDRILFLYQEGYDLSDLE
jgi:predicted O-methyltransferase YrrM